jgi:hypothetical protein
MIDSAGLEVPGLGNTFVLEVSKAGGAFAPSTGVKAEISDGWYSYILTATECDTVGPLSIVVTGVGCIQQNLEYVVKTRITNGKNCSYPVTHIITGLPISGAQVLASTDNNNPPQNIIWIGYSDVFGIARDSAGNLPYLIPGTYYFWTYKPGFTFVIPDTEVVT